MVRVAHKATKEAGWDLPTPFANAKGEAMNLFVRLVP